VTKQSLLADAQSNLDEAQGNLDSIENVWGKRTATHNALIHEYNHELAVLAECIQALNAGGIKRTF
jgi:hypothetical protein